MALPSDGYCSIFQYLSKRAKTLTKKKKIINLCNLLNFLSLSEIVSALTVKIRACERRIRENIVPRVPGIFVTIKIFKENLRVVCNLLLKYCRRQCTLLRTRAKSLTKFNTKRFQKCFGLKLQVKGGLNNLIFSIGFQMLKI